MYIEEIKWIDRENKEAILKVANDTQSLICFSCPCSYNVGNVLSDPLECLDTDDIILCEFEEDYIEKFGYYLYDMENPDFNVDIIHIKYSDYKVVDNIFDKNQREGWELKHNVK